MTAVRSEVCCCGSDASYDRCCGPYHAGAVAPTAEALMRSRYSAYVLAFSDYLLDTWAASTRPERMAIDAGCTWLGLSVRRSEKLTPDEATVEFIARYKVNGRAFRLHEVSRFRREHERWFYVDGFFPEPAAR